ncbi:hypothetical protein DRN73_08300 [Candidatus Pacearchaeota archaeon]|nr:MAG: hypothetical protein DRN73_08300 [Candidatus Pacearchaeota archaeon]
MLYLLFLMMSLKNYVYVNEVKDGVIKIDARVEEEWFKADSIMVIKQWYPYYDSISSFITKVKVLQDRKNLYFLIITDFGNYRPSTNLVGKTESYEIYIDPLLSKVSAYGFEIYANGGRNDFMVLNDGKTYDHSWDAVWDDKVMVFKDSAGNWYLIAEVKIPFKNFRFSKNQDVWGFQVLASFYKNYEKCLWILSEKDRPIKVSKFGFLKGVKPLSEGKGVEVYPVGLFKNAYFSVLDTSKLGKFYPWAGLDFAYKKGGSKINLTLFPDFAEIESDPFSMSFSRYEIYYSEKRPFFLEAKDIFNIYSSSSGLSAKVNVFYSRRIGRKMRDGSGEVPIIFGGKYTGKYEKYEVGLLSALTDNKFGKYDTAWRTSWNVARLKRYFLKNSEMGFILTYKQNLENKNDWVYTADADGVLRFGESYLLYQFVVNKKYDSDKMGFFGQISDVFFIYRNNIFVFSSFYGANDYFDVSDMGYARVYAGDKSMLLGTGFQIFPKRGLFSFLYNSIGFSHWKESPDKYSSRYVFSEGGINLRKPVEFYFHYNVGFGKSCEGEKTFYTKGVSQSFNINYKKFSTWFGYYYSYDWNYSRGYPADQMSFWGGFYLPLFGRISLNPYSSGWVEWDTLGNHLQTVWSVTPYLSYSFTPFMDISFAPNLVFGYYEDKIDLLQLRFAVYYAWEIKPRSKFYVVVNQLFYKNSENNNLETRERIYAVKIRWLFFF